MEMEKWKNETLWESAFSRMWGDRQIYAADVNVRMMREKW